ncbi:chemosensory protein [Danaus plexippus plexippus]|uniref:Chemosensory protein n=1 Tax=Danaus plexippus plexippus TaxID=278856 RepID=A0A212EZC7_DANPL|nr:chemosensory protein [Danaus plexippus plexippus]
MKSIVLFAVIAIAFAEYPYYNLVKLDMDHISKDPLELRRLSDCLLDRGPCTPVYDTYKAVTKEAIESLCMKCSLYQKHIFWQFLQALRAISPNDYILYKQKYDVDNKYFGILESILSQFNDSY